jgi:hypothetical protein
MGSCGPAVLHAIDPNNLATEFWNSSVNAADTASNAVKFTVPQWSTEKCTSAHEGTTRG